MTAITHGAFGGSNADVMRLLDDMWMRLLHEVGWCETAGRRSASACGNNRRARRLAGSNSGSTSGTCRGRPGSSRRLGLGLSKKWG